MLHHLTLPQFQLHYLSDLLSAVFLCLVLLLLDLALVLHPLQQELGVDVRLFEEVLQAQVALLLHHAPQVLDLLHYTTTNLSEVDIKVSL